MEIISEKENKLLNRNEIALSFQSDKVTSDRASIKAEIVKKFKIDEKLVVITEIKTLFGSRNFKVFANLYENDENLSKIETEHILIRNGLKEKAVSED